VLLVSVRGEVGLEGLGKFKKFVHLIGFRTHEPPACSTVPQPPTQMFLVRPKYATASQAAVTLNCRDAYAGIHMFPQDSTSRATLDFPKDVQSRCGLSPDLHHSQRRASSGRRAGGVRPSDRSGTKPGPAVQLEGTAFSSEDKLAGTALACRSFKWSCFHRATRLPSGSIGHVTNFRTRAVLGLWYATRLLNVRIQSPIA
jgi:hypothetical protein